MKENIVLDVKDFELLEKNWWFSQLPEIFQKFIRQYSIVQNYQREQAIFRSGDIFNGIYAVLDGRVCLGYIDIQCF